MINKNDGVFNQGDLYCSDYCFNSKSKLSLIKAKHKLEYEDVNNGISQSSIVNPIISYQVYDPMDDF